MLKWHNPSNSILDIECEITKIVLKRRNFWYVFSFFLKIMRKFVPRKNLYGNIANETSA